MKLQEQWIPWKPEPLLTMYYYVESITEDERNGLTIIYHEGVKHDHKFKISFKQSVYAFRHANESFRLKTLGDLDACYDRELYKGHTMFKVANSNFIALIGRRSLQTIDTSKFIHFVFMTSDEFLDIIASEEPACESYYQAKES